MKSLLACILIFGSLNTNAALSQNFDVELLAGVDQRLGTQTLTEKAKYLIDGQISLLALTAMNARLEVMNNGSKKDSLCFLLGGMNNDITEITFMVIGGEKHNVFSSTALRIAQNILDEQKQLNFYCTGVEGRGQTGDIIEVEGVEAKINLIKSKLEDLQRAIQ